MKYERKRNFPRGIWWAIAGLVFIFVLGLAVSFYYFRTRAKTELTQNAQGLQAGVAALENFDFKTASQQFGIVAASSSNLQMAGGIFGMFFSSKNPVGSIVDLSKQMASLSNELQSAESDVLNMAPSSTTVETHGTVNFGDDVSALQSTLHGIDDDVTNLSSAIAITHVSLPGGLDLVSFETKLHGAENFLDAFAPWLSNPVPHHILVLFQNPSELRPAGGFLGSYADVTIASGTIVNVDVHDIADVDAGFKENIIPPKPLQLEVSKWRPADANWFFDFPTSGGEVISTFESSTLYSASGTQFNGVIAVSSGAVSDLLSVTGPVTVTVTSTLSKAGTTVTFNNSNFMVQIQKIVQAEQAARNAGGANVKNIIYPKQVLANLVQEIFASLASSTDAQKEQLVGLAGNWITDKDVMMYFKDSAFENFATDWGAAGDVYALPQNFEGDYLAIVNANINGQKSDLYIHEDVNWQSQINSDGTVDDHLSITRTHTGNTSPYWWYDAPNQTYVQLFVPSHAILTNESGAILRSIPAPINYAKSGYSTDPLIASIESSTAKIVGYPAITTHQESGKEVFAAWSRVSPGSTATLSFDYTNRLYVPVTDGTSYQFIFEKQSGTNRHYTLEIDAPLGYMFAETGLASWTMDTDDIPGRLVVNLTLQNI